jgi:ribosome maturation protein SDO1
VNKGEAAPKADLEKAWGKGKAKEDIIKDILEHGEFQVGEKERGAELGRTKNEVVDIVASKLVDPKTKRVYTTGMIEKALDQLSSQSANAPEKTADPDAPVPQELPKWSGVVSGKSAKSQALWAIKCLVAHQPIPVARMQMRLRITCATSVLKQGVKTAPKAGSAKGAEAGDDKSTATVKDAILGYMEKVESQETMGSEWEATGLVEPGTFKTMNEFIESNTKGRGNVEVLDMAVGVDI